MTCDFRNYCHWNGEIQVSTWYKANVSCTYCTTGTLLYYTESNIHSHKVKGHESTTTSGLTITTDIDLFSLRIIVSSHDAKSAHLFWPWFATISLNSHDVLWKNDQRLFCFDYKITLNISWSSSFSKLKKRTSHTKQQVVNVILASAVISLPYTQNSPTETKVC